MERTLYSIGWHVRILQENAFSIYWETRSLAGDKKGADSRGLSSVTILQGQLFFPIIYEFLIRVESLIRIQVH